jgi:hypothetical protein
MTRYKAVCLLLGSIVSIQAVGSRSLLDAQTIAEPATRGQGPESGTTNVEPGKALITIEGLCDNSSDDKAVASNCKTIITRAQFEKVINAVQPNMPARTRREFALHYADALVMAKKAEEMGLDKGTNYEEQMKLARVQVLSQDLKRTIQEKTSQISDKEIEDYYQSNTAKFEKVEVDRIYVPRNQQPLSASENKLILATEKQRSQESGPIMKEEADNLRARAVAGEDVTRLQADAYQVAGIRSAAPNTRLEIRRASLPPSQVSVMDLKPGDVSSVLTDPNGYLIYKIKAKDTLSLDQAREEIKAILRTQKMQKEMRDIQDSPASLDESYFVR